MFHDSIGGVPGQVVGLEILACAAAIGVFVICGSPKMTDSTVSQIKVPKSVDIVDLVSSEGRGLDVEGAIEATHEILDAGREAASRPGVDIGAATVVVRVADLGLAAVSIEIIEDVVIEAANDVGAHVPQSGMLICKPRFPLMREGYQERNQGYDQKCGNDPHDDRKNFVALDRLLQLVKFAGGARRNWLLRQEALHIERQTVGGFVTAGAILLQRLHHDPIQVATDGSDQSRRLGLATLSDSR